MFHVCQTWGERSLFGELIDCAAGLAGVVVRGVVFVGSECLDRAGSPGIPTITANSLTGTRPRLGDCRLAVWSGLVTGRSGQ